MEGLEHAVEWYVRYLATPVAQGVQWFNDAMPYAVDDILPVAFAVGLPVAGGVYGCCGPEGRRKIRRRAAVVALSLCIYAANLSIVGSRPDAYRRFGMEQGAILVEDHETAAVAHEEEAMRLERAFAASTFTVPDTAVCDAVLRTMRALNEPVVENSCIVRSSVLSRTLRENGDAIGVFNPFSRDLAVELEVGNYWRPAYLAHELVHSHQVFDEAQADFLMYLSLTSAQGAYAPSLRQVGHLWRARSERMAFLERTDTSSPWHAPARAVDDYALIVRKTPEARNAPRTGSLDAPSSLERAAREAPASVARYDLGFIGLAHAWDRSGASVPDSGF